jgi:hypothetical protein
MFNFVKQQTENQNAGIRQITVSYLDHTATIQTKISKNKLYPPESKEKTN